MIETDCDINTAELSRFIWDNRYRYRNKQGEIVDVTPDDTWRRVARALASVETGNTQHWENNFYHILKNLQFIPGGRILAGSGVDRSVTLFNCFVMGDIRDATAKLIKSLGESDVTLQYGGGIGCDFSTLHPRGIALNIDHAVAHGPVYAMQLWNDMCATMAGPTTTGSRRHGAMMATLRCDHPDIEDFIHAKHQPGRLHNFNLSVLINDEFMLAVERDALWPLLFPAAKLAAEPADSEHLMRTWSGEKSSVLCRVIRKVRARELWQKLLRANYAYGEPGVLFIDRINRFNNLWYCETISCTNPCGEVPLPAYGACDLGSVNLPRFVRNPFTAQAQLDMESLRDTVQIATRLLDNVVDLSTYPLPEQQQQAHAARRLGLGITGLADALIRLGLHYAEPAARDLAANVMRTIRDSAYQTSVDLAREKGAFPLFQADNYLKGENIRQLSVELRAAIAQTGIRNSHLTAVAPAGAISLLAGNVSNGIEPLFGLRYAQKILCCNGLIGNGIGTGMGGTGSGGIGNGGRGEESTDLVISNPSYQLWLDTIGNADALPEYFVTAHQLPPSAHLAMVAALQPYVDSAISKTVNVRADISFADFCAIYEQAYLTGLKGCTTFRSGMATDAVIADVADK